jgi:NifU-like protein involved in Fe-S cluster formation
MLYSKEIMKHFKNPQNVGKMKNPSAVGKVGNLRCGDVMYLYLKIKGEKGKDIIKDVKFETFGCLPPREQVSVGEGDWENISLTEKGEEIMNGAGKHAKILNVFNRDYNGPILKIVPFVSPLNSFSVTPEHPILCIKRDWLKSARKSGSACRWLRCQSDELVSEKPRYIPAGEICKSDYLVFMPNKTVRDSDYFTPDLMRLIGYYLAEGYSSAKESVLAFSFNKKEKEYITETKSLILKITGKEAKSRIRDQVEEVYVCSRKWVKTFKSLAGSLAFQKRLSDDILTLPFYKQWEMIDTYTKGDGYLVKRRPKDSYTYRLSTVSKDLAVQLQEILARGGIFSSIKEDTDIERKSHIEGRKVNCRILYEVSFKLERKNKFVHFTGKYFLVPVKDVQRSTYSGTVYNIQTDNPPHSYLVKGFVVHNCTVAVANTSLLTTMIKGQTLDYALKITKEDMIKKFGEVPFIKVHCSMLALDALAEAIYNYYVEMKKPISKELLERHEKAERISKEIEERHKELVELEEKIHRDEQ